MRSYGIGLAIAMSAFCGPALSEPVSTWSLSVLNFPVLSWRQGGYYDQCGAAPEVMNVETEKKIKLVAEGLGGKVAKGELNVDLREERKNALTSLGGEAVAKHRIDYYGCVFIMSNEKIDLDKRIAQFARFRGLGLPEQAAGPNGGAVAKVAFIFDGQAMDGQADSLLVPLPTDIGGASAMQLAATVKQIVRAGPPAGFINVEWGTSDAKMNWLDHFTGPRLRTPAGLAENLTPQVLTVASGLTSGGAKLPFLLLKITHCGYTVFVPPSRQATDEDNGKAPGFTPATCQFRGDVSFFKP